MLRKIADFGRSLCTVIGALFFITILLLGLAGYWYGRQRGGIADNSVLVVNFADNFTESQDIDLLAELQNKQSMKVRTLTTAIELAAQDKRITTLVALINTSNLDFAQIQDISRSVRIFNQTGKKSYAFSQGFGMLGQGNREYYLASFFDKIYMQPHTEIGLTGIDIEVPFASNLMQKLGVKADFYSRYEYKTAMASFTDKKMSAAYKENMQDLAKSFMNELRADISANRKLNADFDDIVNKAPLSAEEGIKLNLIDGTRYLSDLEKELTENGAQNFVHIMDYVGQMQFNSGELPTVAVLNLNGVMDTGNSDNELAGDPVIGSADVAEELAEISELPDLRAVIVRVNSPGGSYNAADEIYYALQRLKKEKNVPLIISQSGYAASGGYFVSLAGDYIVAEPTTVTGSIGVLGGKFVFADLWKKLGINWESITVGKNADILSLNKPFTPAEQKIFNASLDDVYNDFTAKTVENRPLKKDINLIARGRVWSGRQAFDLGLVDELGGFRNALKVAAQRGGISPNEKYKIVEYPRAKSVRERIAEIIFGKFVRSPKIILPYNVDIRYLKLFKRLQYDTVTVPFIINM